MEFGVEYFGKLRREHMQRCGKNEGDKINYTISNTDIDIQFPNRSGIC